MSKYNQTKKVFAHGLKRDSKLELQYYEYLCNLVDDTIDCIFVHPTYILLDKFISDGKNIQATKYIADFEIVRKDGSIEAIDIKGFAKESALLKRKMFLHRYPSIKLKWITRYKGERVDHFDNEKRKRDNKKIKHEKVNI